MSEVVHCCECDTVGSAAFESGRCWGRGAGLTGRADECDGGCVCKVGQPVKGESRVAAGDVGRPLFVRSRGSSVVPPVAVFVCNSYLFRRIWWVLGFLVFPQFLIPVPKDATNKL